MNAVCIVIAVLFLICVLAGWIRGLFKMVVSAAGLIASIVVAIYVAPHVSGYLEKNTDMDERIAAAISQNLQYSKAGEDATRAVQVAVINELPLPEVMKSNILDNNNSEMYVALKVKNVYDYIAKSVAVVILNATVFLVLAFACRVFFFFLARAMKEWAKIPIVGSIDKLGGGFIGVLKGLIYIWVFFLILSITSTFAWSQELTAQIMQSDVLKLLYDNNILLNIVGDLTGVLFL